jgi:hypothetical protein
MSLLGANMSAVAGLIGISGSSSGQAISIASGEGPEAGAAQTVLSVADSGAGGSVQVSSGLDGNIYDTERLTLTTAGVSINSTSRVVVFSQHLGVGTYDIEVWAVVSNSTAGDGATWSFAATGGLVAGGAGSGMDFHCTLTASPATVTYGAAGNYTTAFPNQGPAGNQRLDIRLTLVVATAGTLTWGGVENAAGNPVSVASGSRMRIFPVVAT